MIGAFFFIVFLHPLKKPRAVDTITVYMYMFVPQRSGWCLVTHMRDAILDLPMPLARLMGRCSIKVNYNLARQFRVNTGNYWTVTCEGSGHWEFSAVREFTLCRVNEAYKKRPKKIRQRWRQWKRRWKIDFASFQFFYPHTKSHSYLKVRNLVWNWREGTRAPEFREKQ